LRYERRVGQGCQLDEPHAVSEAVQVGPRYFQGQASLAAPAYTGDRHQAVLTKDLFKFDQFAGTRDKTGRRQRQVVLVVGRPTVRYGVSP
jgi:hypothetical protein